MKRLWIAAVLLAGCPGPGSSANPSELWLAPNGSELLEQLSPVEPDPF
jgi:hypothetical protein